MKKKQHYAANGLPITDEQVEELNRLYREILDIIDINNLSSIDALINALMAVAFNQPKPLKLEKIQYAVKFLYEWWEISKPPASNKLN